MRLIFLTALMKNYENDDDDKDSDDGNNNINNLDSDIVIEQF